MSDKFDRISEWLLRAALFDVSLEELVEQLCKRLIDSGVPVSRISLGRTLMHPVIGMLDVTWDEDIQRADWTILPRSAVRDEMFETNPFGEVTIAAEKILDSVRDLGHVEASFRTIEFPGIHADLTNPETRARYPIYDRLAAAGLTGYAAFSSPFGLRKMASETGKEYTLGASVSYATKRRSGFTVQEVEGFRRILVPLMATVRVVTEQFFAAELMEAYLGRISGRSVLSGQISRGDVQSIDCALVYSDMRASTRLGQRLCSEEYVATLNRYFDCIAGSVLDHGGEVLKFVGDALLIVFPIDAQVNKQAACQAAVDAAIDAQATLSTLNHRQRRNGLPQIEFGVGLNVGEVVYGNIGAPDRLDFTVIGPAVNRTSRLESLTKELGVNILLSREFAEQVSNPVVSLGLKSMKGIADDQEVFGLDASF